MKQRLWWVESIWRNRIVVCGLYPLFVTNDYVDSSVPIIFRCSRFVSFLNMFKNLKTSYVINNL